MGSGCTTRTRSRRRNASTLRTAASPTWRCSFGATIWPWSAAASGRSILRTRCSCGTTSRRRRPSRWTLTPRSRQFGYGGTGSWLCWKESSRFTRSHKRRRSCTCSKPAKTARACACSVPTATNHCWRFRAGERDTCRSSTWRIPRRPRRRLSPTKRPSAASR
uniref:(northern house mosquito) hypothetical protein n=1 Tax=Culex pipiens TaxID=7175 RepID=A0A8D8P015_CULPI